MKGFKFNIKREAKVVAVLLVLVLLIAFSERKQQQLDIQDVIIHIENSTSNHFIDEKDISGLMDLSIENLKGANVEKLNMRALENKIKRNRFISDAEIYTDLKGNLVVNVTLRRPIARIIRSDGPDGYIAEDGTIMEVTNKYTSRVMLVGGSMAGKLIAQENLMDSDEGEKLMAMLRIINYDEFWQAQVAQVDVKKNGYATIYPQVTKQLIEFGAMENLEMKFKKLRIFYKEILPRKGWNKYERVNLEYEGQIVAE